MKFFIIILCILYITQACHSDVECQHNGTCILANETCLCWPGYMDSDCSYVQKKQSIAFLSSLWFGYLGVDRLYLDYVELAIIKFLLSLISLCAFFTLGNGNLFPLKICFQLGAILCFLSLAIWWLLDMTLILTLAIQDANGYPIFKNIPSFHYF